MRTPASVGGLFQSRDFKPCRFGVAKQGDNCYVSRDTGFSAFGTTIVVRFWAGTLAGLAFWRVHFLEIVAVSRCELAVGIARGQW
jgi:hypothetical protein